MPLMEDRNKPCVIWIMNLFFAAPCLFLILFTHPAFGAIGDNAPPIPASYVTSHPRLGAPPNSWLLSLWNGGALPSRYSAAAGTATTGFDTTCLQQNCDGVSFRYLLTSYLASKAAGAPNAVWKNKLITLAGLGGTWGRVMFRDDNATADSSACTNTCTIADASANFLTGCAGSCTGEYLTVLGMRYTIVSVTDATHAVIKRFSNGQPYPFPNGTGLKIRVLDSLYDTGETAYYHAMLYDWMYSDFTAQQRADMQTSLANLCVQFENDYVNSNYSPYNDLFYMGQNGWVGQLGMFAAAIAIYPDSPSGLQHLKWASDVLLNVMLPAWKHIMGTGGWHEAWNDYIVSNANVTLKAHIVGALLPWANATGNMPGFFTVDNPWLKNFSYLTMYMSKPDYILEKLGAASTTVFTGEYGICSTGSSMGALNGLAEIYNDPVVRGWARLVNSECRGGPDGFEPSAWPYFTPDRNSNATSDRSSLPLCHNFTGWGTLICRSGWGEDDTWMSFRYGDDFWSHQHFDSGSFTLFNRGSLAIDSGTYHAGSFGRHYDYYATQTIAHNTITVKDPSDNYPSQLVEDMTSTSSSVICEAVPNDGGQRRVASGWQTYFTTAGCGGPVSNVAINSPATLGAWLKHFQYFHYGTLLAYAPSPSETLPRYVYFVADLTAAYNSAGLTPTVSNRTQRVQKFLRHIIFIPRNHAGYLVVYDQITANNATFVKKWLLHSINQPAVTGSKFVIQRTENVTSKPYPGTWPGGFMNSVLTHAPDRSHYQYAGQLTGFSVKLPNYSGPPTLTTVGGAGHEFDDGTGKNQNECQYSQQCADAGDPWGLGDTNAGCAIGTICPTSAAGGQEPGAWRIEEQPNGSGSNTQDWFLHVMLASAAGDTNVPVSVTTPANLPAGMVGATWADSANTYTITLPQSGIGGHITITGLVDEDLLSHAQPIPTQLQVVSGDAQSGTSGTQLPSQLVVVAKDGSGNVVANATVLFAVAQGNGLLSSSSATTDSQGHASVGLTMGAGTGGSLTTVMAYTNGVQPVSFNATLGSSGGSPPAVSSVSCSPSSLAAGAISNCTVTLSQPAGAGGSTVSLASDSRALTVPGGVTVAAGSSSVVFTAVAGSVSTAQTAVVTATLNGSQTTSISLLSTLPSLSSISCLPSTLSSGATASCTLTLTASAGSGGAIVTLSSNTPQLTVPAAASVAAGSSSVNFTVIAGTISASLSAVVTATFSGVSQTAFLSLAMPSSGGIPIPTGSWITIPTQGFPAQTVGYGKLVYAPSPVKKAVALDNYHGLSSEPNEALVAYDFEANRWDVLDIGSSFHSEYMPEGGHPVGGFTYDPTLKTFIYYCCASGSNQPETPYGLWWYDPVGQTGRDKMTSSKPGATQYQTATFDYLTNTYVLQGGVSWVGTWTYKPATNIFQQQQPAGTAPDPSIAQAAMAFNTSDHKVYLFGGDAVAFSNDLYRYDVSANTWTLLAPTGPRPSPRWRAAFAYDSTNNVFLLYGGQDDTRVYNDSWIYNPVANTWAQLNPAQSPPLLVTAPFESLTYDSDHNVFILVVSAQGGYAGGSFGYGAQVWFFRYQGTGPNPGTASPSFQPTSGGINKNVDAWAKEPSLAGSGTVLYTSWVETGKPFDTSTATWFHVYASQRNGGTWVPMGGLPNSIDSEFSNYSESHSPSISIIAGTPWISWYKSNNSGIHWGLWAKSWNGTSWQGGPVDIVGTDPNRIYQGRSQMADVAGVPHVAFLEVDKTYYPQRTLLYVKYWNGTQWVLKGTAPLNINASANTAATSVSMASDGTNPYVAWTEYTFDNAWKSATPPQVYVAHWDGTQWVAVGGSVNVSSAGWANDASITYLGGQPYVAWTERAQAGNNQVFVKTFDGANWTLVGSGTLNKDTNTGWALRPSLVADAASSSLYLGWVEQQDLGQRAQTYVSKFSGGTWTALGASLNADTTLGSAQRVSLAVVSGQPVAAWGEVKFGSLRQVFAKQWNGSSWALLTGTSAPAPPSCDLNGDGLINITDVQLAINQVLGIAPCTTANLTQTGKCNITDVQRVITVALGGTCKVGP